MSGIMNGTAICFFPRMSPAYTKGEVCKIAHIPDYIILSKKIKKSGHEQIHDN